MAKFIKVEEEYENGKKYVTYVNLNNVTHISANTNAEDICTYVQFTGHENNCIKFNIPLSDFMDLVNSAK